MISVRRRPRLTSIVLTLNPEWPCSQTSCMMYVMPLPPFSLIFISFRQDFFQKTPFPFGDIYYQRALQLALQNGIGSGKCFSVFLSPESMLISARCRPFGILNNLNQSLTRQHPALWIWYPSAFYYFFYISTKHIVLQHSRHLVDYATHEVPLPLFGLGHDWACTFSGAPLPCCGQARAPEFIFCEASQP